MNSVAPSKPARRRFKPSAGVQFPGPACHVRFCSTPPPLTADWSHPSWQLAETVRVEQFRPESSAHRPKTSVRLLCSPESLHGIFRVQDRYVRCIRTRYFDEVWKDSAVEFLVQPKPERGYFGFEFNCGGAHLCNYITDSTLVNGTWKKSERMPAELGQQVLVKSSLPPWLDPEIAQPLSWTLQFYLPLSVLEPFVGAVRCQPGQVWRGNFFKCAQDVSHPHWAAWSPVDEFNFHLPRCFGWLFFET